MLKRCLVRLVSMNNNDGAQSFEFVVSEQLFHVLPTGAGDLSVGFGLEGWVEMEEYPLKLREGDIFDDV